MYKLRLSVLSAFRSACGLSFRSYWLSNAGLPERSLLARASRCLLSATQPLGRRMEWRRASCVTHASGALLRAWCPSSCSTRLTQPRYSIEFSRWQHFECPRTSVRLCLCQCATTQEGPTWNAYMYKYHTSIEMASGARVKTAGVSRGGGGGACWPRLGLEE